MYALEIFKNLKSRLMYPYYSFKDRNCTREEKNRRILNRLGIKTRKLDPNNDEDLIQLRINQFNSYHRSEALILKDFKFETKFYLMQTGFRNCHKYNEYVEYLEKETEKLTIKDFNKKNKKNNMNILTYSEWFFK